MWGPAEAKAQCRGVLDEIPYVLEYRGVGATLKRGAAERAVRMGQGGLELREAWCLVRRSQHGFRGSAGYDRSRP
jgi:hypothetical protein